MTQSVDLFFSLRSPYSYLAMKRLFEMQRDYDCTINARLVYPLAVRDPSVVGPKQAPKLKYILMDCLREANFLGLPIAWPNPDPIKQDMTTFTIAKDQPLIRKLIHLGIAAKRKGKGLDFLYYVSDLIFNGETQGWDRDENLDKTFQKFGLTLAQLNADIKGHENDIEDEIAANQAALDSSGHWGVPTMVYQGQPFFGQDRIDTLLWAMKENGLKTR